MGDVKNQRALRRRSEIDLRRAVAVAHSAGRTWDDIGRVLHLSGKKTAERYGPRLPWQSLSRRLVATVLMRGDIE
jgi:hypothetical protein